MPLPVLVAPDSFKGTLRAQQVAAALADGLRAAGCVPDVAPLADGGEGTAEVLGRQFDAHWMLATVRGPEGGLVQAGFFLDDARRAWLDTAAANGLALVAHPDPGSAWAATTAGTGELIVAARDAGAREISVGVGGSATTDGGRGAVAAVSTAGGLGDVRLVVLCDVTTTWSDAPSVFGPQKGADPATVRDLEARLEVYARRLPKDPRGLPMTGAAGGLAGGLWAAFGAELRAGADEVLQAVGLRERASSAVAVVTGEGRFDRQSLLGKVASAVLAASARPVHLVVGSSELGEPQARDAGFASLTIAGDVDALTAAGHRLGEQLRARHDRGTRPADGRAIGDAFG